MKLNKAINLLGFLILTHSSLVLFSAEQTVQGTVKEGYEDAKKNVKKNISQSKRQNL